jgi:hypothetical protein
VDELAETGELERKLEGALGAHYRSAGAEQVAQVHA